MYKTASKFWGKNRSLAKSVAGSQADQKMQSKKERTRTILTRCPVCGVTVANLRKHKSQKHATLVYKKPKPRLRKAETQLAESNSHRLSNVPASKRAVIAPKGRDAATRSAPANRQNVLTRLRVLPPRLKKDSDGTGTVDSSK